MKTYLEITADKDNYVTFANPDDFTVGVVDNDGKPKVYEHTEMGRKREALMKDVLSGQVSKSDFLLLQKKMRGQSGFLKYLFSPSQYRKAISK